MRSELFLRGTVRPYGVPDGESAVMSGGMLPAAFAAASAAAVARGIRGSGRRPCSPLGLAEERTFRAELSGDDAALVAGRRPGGPPLAPAASAAVSFGGTRVRPPHGIWFPSKTTKSQRAALTPGICLFSRP